MYLVLSLLSAILLGCYDIAKKRAVTDNAVLPVLLFSTLFSAIIFAPFIVDAEFGMGWFDGGNLSSSGHGGEEHKFVLIKATLSLLSWIFGYMSIKHLPITIAGTINATRPVMVLVGALFIYGDRLNLWQWSGVILSFISLVLLSQVSKKEGIKFSSNKWIMLAMLASICGVSGALYDKHIMQSLDATFVMGWTNIYQTLMMVMVVLCVWYPTRRRSTPFRWSWAIPLISITLSLGDFAYLSALAEDDAMISIVSMLRRGSVVVTFICGAIFFKEQNIRGKAIDLLLIIIGMMLIFIGS